MEACEGYAGVITEYRCGINKIYRSADKPKRAYVSAARAAQLAKDANAGRVVITHLNPGIDPVGLLAEARAVRLDAVLAASGEGDSAGR